MDFLVYGYMNRGTHEGETGVALYTYDALTNSVEERVFIESRESFAVLQSKLGEMAYVNDDGQFYIFLDGAVNRIDLNTMEYATVAAWFLRTAIWRPGIRRIPCMPPGTWPC